MSLKRFSASHFGMEKIKIVQLIMGAIFSLLFSASIVLGRMINYHNNMYGFFDENYIRRGELSDLIKFIIIAGVVFVVVIFLMKNWKFVSTFFITTKGRTNSKKFVIISAFVITACWIPYILALAPGSVLEDSYVSISQMLEYGHPTNNHHPIAYSLLVGLFCNIGISFGDINIGVFIYSIFQAMIMLFTFSGILRLLYEKRIASWVLVLCVLYFSLFPLFPYYAVIMWKDPIFSCGLLWMSMLLLRQFFGDNIKYFEAKMTTAALVSILFRNNGIYIVVGMLVFAFLIREKSRKKIILSFLLALVIFAGFKMFAKTTWKTMESEFIENMGIPVQQIAYCIANGDEFSEEDREYLDSFLPIEDWKGAYMPCMVDTIKWHHNANYEVIEFNRDGLFKAWIHAVRDYPMDCIKAYLLQTQGFWRIDAQNSMGYAEYEQFECEYGFKAYDFGFMPDGLRDFLRSFMIYVPTGIFVFLMLLALVLSANKQFGILMAFLPPLFCLFTIMVATPLAFSLRYVLVVAFGFPLFVATPIMAEANKS